MRMVRYSLLITAILNFVSGSTITFPETPEQKYSSSADSRPETTEVGTPGSLIYHVANVGLKILRELAKSNSNVILSPLNVYSSLGILGLGASGTTKNEIASFIGPTGPNHSNFINSMNAASSGISYASALFLNHYLVPKPEFVKGAVCEYLAAVQNVNMSDGEGTKSLINRWVSDQTNGTIANLLQGLLDPNTKLILASTLLFNGKWLQSFSPSATTWGKFTANEGFEPTDVRLMHLTGNISIVRNSLLDAIGLPYQSHGMRMYLILPKIHGVSGVRKLLSHLNVNSLRKLKKESVSEEIIVVVPKVVIDGRYSLGNTLRTLGLLSMFDPVNASFTNMVDDVSPLYLTDVYHSVHFEMNEEGTTASAATASIFTKSSKFVFKATRPFISVITNEDDLILFMGIVVNP